MLQLLIGGTDYSQYYQSKSLELTGQAGNEKSHFKFKLAHTPSIPSYEAATYVYNTPSQTTLEMAGRVRRVRRITSAYDPVGAAIVFTLEVEVNGWVRDISRRPPFQQIYPSPSSVIAILSNLPWVLGGPVTTGFIMNDIIRNQLASHGFTAGNITTAGTLLGSPQPFELRMLPINKAFDLLANLEGFQWWVDDTKKIHFTDPLDNPPAPFSITDANYDQICGASLVVEPDTDNLANYLAMDYKSTYSEGLCVVTNGQQSVTGINTHWTSRLKPGATIQFNGIANISYTIQNVVSDTLLTLSSAYNETNSPATGCSYRVINISSTIDLADPVSIAAMAAITGDDGIYADKVSGPGSMYLDESQAITYLRGIMAIRANPIVNIRFNTDSYKISGKIEAGQAVTFNSTLYNINNTFQIKQLNKKDTGAIDANGNPVWSYQIAIETRLYDLASRLKAIESAVSSFVVSDPSIVDRKFIAQDLVTVTEVATLADNSRWAPFVWGPSVQQWDTQADWQTGTLSNIDATTSPGFIQISGSNLSGTWTSPAIIQYSPNGSKGSSVSSTLPGGCTITVQYRSSADQSTWSSWYSIIYQVPDNKYLQAQIVLTRPNTGVNPTVDYINYTPHKSLINWGNSTWGTLTNTINTAAQWQTWTLVNTDATTVPGVIQLAAAQTSGTATSPWMKNNIRTVAQTFTPTISTGGTSTITYQFRTSPDAGATVSAWSSNWQQLTDNFYVQVQAVFSGDGVHNPQLQSIVISPN